MKLMNFGLRKNGNRALLPPKNGVDVGLVGVSEGDEIVRIAFADNISAVNDRKCCRNFMYFNSRELNVDRPLCIEIGCVRNKRKF